MAAGGFERESGVSNLDVTVMSKLTVNEDELARMLVLYLKREVRGGRADLPTALIAIAHATASLLALCDTIEETNDLRDKLLGYIDASVVLWRDKYAAEREGKAG